jgi:hypothetical protein
MQRIATKTSPSPLQQQHKHPPSPELSQDDSDNVSDEDLLLIQQHPRVSQHAIKALTPRSSPPPNTSQSDQDEPLQKTETAKGVTPDSDDDVKDILSETILPTLVPVSNVVSQADIDAVKKNDDDDDVDDNNDDADLSGAISLGSTSRRPLLSIKSKRNKVITPVNDDDGEDELEKMLAGSLIIVSEQSQGPVKSTTKLDGVGRNVRFVPRPPSPHGSSPFSSQHKPGGSPKAISPNMQKGSPIATFPADVLQGEKVPSHFIDTGNDGGDVDSATLFEATRHSPEAKSDVAGVPLTTPSSMSRSSQESTDSPINLDLSLPLLVPALSIPAPVVSGGMNGGDDDSAVEEEIMPVDSSPVVTHHLKPASSPALGWGEKESDHGDADHVLNMSNDSSISAIDQFMASVTSEANDQIERDAVKPISIDDIGFDDLFKTKDFKDLSSSRADNVAASPTKPRQLPPLVLPPLKLAGIKKPEQPSSSLPVDAASTTLTKQTSYEEFKLQDQLKAAPPAKVTDVKKKNVKPGDKSPDRWDDWDDDDDNVDNLLL